MDNKDTSLSNTPSGKTLYLSLALVVISLVLIEGVARQPFARERYPSTGTQRDLRRKSSLVETYAGTHDGVECVFIGSSMTDRDIDPEEFKQGLRKITGAEVDCFNFGLAGSTASEYPLIADRLIEAYHPHWIIVGISPRDFNPNFGSPAQLALTGKRPGLRLSADTDIQDWFKQYSTAYLYYAGAINWYKDIEREQVVKKLVISESGYTYQPGVEGRLPEVIFEEMFAAYQSLAEITFDEADWEGFETLSAWHGQKTNILVVEMPLPRTFWPIFAGGQTTYRTDFIVPVETFLASKDILFLQIYDLELIPDAGWEGYFHLNRLGATAFSEWLGIQVGQAVMQEQLTLPH